VAPGFSPGRYHRSMKLKVVLEPSEEGGYTVFVPALRGCVSEGDSREEALKNIREAIDLYLDLTDEEIAISEEAEVEELVV
jgi:predicted RNase H-like HicB family nuclease